MKRVCKIGLIVLLGLVLCSGVLFAGGRREEVRDDQFRVAMLLPGPITDEGWSQTAYEGLLKIRDELGAHVDYVEMVLSADMEELFRGYAVQGYDVIIGHGFEYGDPASEIAPDFPNTKFVINSSTFHQAPNIASILNDGWQMGFLSGSLAGLMTESNVIGSVAGMEIESIIAFHKGFTDGAKYVNPDVEAVTAYIGNFSDAATAKEMAISMIERGADVITHNANEAGMGVMEAAREYNVPMIGAIGDQQHLEPSVIVTSAINDMVMAIFSVVEIIHQGGFEPVNYVMGVAEGCIDLAPLRHWEDKIDPAIIDRVMEIREDLREYRLTRDQF